MFKSELAGGGGTDLTGLGVDDRIARWDGPDTLQSSGITLNDTDDVDGINDLTMDGDLEVAGLASVGTIIDATTYLKVGAGSSATITGAGDFLGAYTGSSSLIRGWVRSLGTFNPSGSTAHTRFAGIESSPFNFQGDGSLLDYSGFWSHPGLAGNAIAPTNLNYYFAEIGTRQSDTDPVNVFGLRIDNISEANTTRTVGVEIATLTLGTTKVGIDINANLMEWDEMTAPSAPGANQGRLFLRDDGGGKTELAIIFNTGAIQVIAAQP